MTMTDLAAELAEVCVEYASVDGPVFALRKVSVGFPTKSSTAIVGRSGSGKSTLISVLALMRRPNDGSVRIGDVDISTLSAARIASLRATEVGIVFQSFHLENSLTAAENVMLPWFFRSTTNRRAARLRARTVLEALEIGDLEHRRPNEMSGGQRQRVAIARALFTSPRLFIADEPTGNLDEDTANKVAETILSLPSDFGTTVVLVTHDAAVAARAQRRLSLVRGELTE